MGLVFDLFTTVYCICIEVHDLQRMSVYRTKVQPSRLLTGDDDDRTSRHRRCSGEVGSTVFERMVESRSKETANIKTLCCRW